MSRIFISIFFSACLYFTEIKGAPKLPAVSGRVFCDDCKNIDVKGLAVKSTIETKMVSGKLSQAATNKSSIEVEFELTEENEEVNSFEYFGIVANSNEVYDEFRAEGTVCESSNENSDMFDDEKTSSETVEILNSAMEKQF